MFLNFFLKQFQRNIRAKRVYLASVVSPGSPTKEQYSPVTSNLSRAFKGASFAERKSDGDRNAALEKEVKLCVQVLYPYIAFTTGESFTKLCINGFQYKGGKISPVWCCNIIFFTAACKEVVDITKTVDTGAEWLNYAIKCMVDTKTQDTCYEVCVQKIW
jgi:hypothetical protein